MSRQPLFASFDEGGIVVCGDGIDPEPPIPVGDVAPRWNACTIPGCRHDLCPAKLRAWTRFGRRYICDDQDCGHRDCAPKRRAEEDDQAFGVSYDGPALPQHKVDLVGTPLGPSMRAVKDDEGNWRLVPMTDRQRDGSGSPSR